jgi:hypothetical protein
MMHFGKVQGEIDSAFIAAVLWRGRRRRWIGFRWFKFWAWI